MAYSGSRTQLARSHSRIFPPTRPHWKIGDLSIHEWRGALRKAAKNVWSASIDFFANWVYIATAPTKNQK
jgi:hypothetical protein